MQKPDKTETCQNFTPKKKLLALHSSKTLSVYMYQTINSHQLKRNSEVVKSDM